MMDPSLVMVGMKMRDSPLNHTSWKLSLIYWGWGGLGHTYWCLEVIPHGAGGPCDAGD